MNVLKLEKKVNKNEKLSCCFYKKKAIEKKKIKKWLIFINTKIILKKKIQLFCWREKVNKNK